MLPGFRFLFAAIILSMSVLVFGLGAAALLRAAHEQFASIPLRRATPEPVFAQRSEPLMPTLALLRFEPPVAEKAPNNVAGNAGSGRDRDAPRPCWRPTPAGAREISRAERRRGCRDRSGKGGNPGGRAAAGYPKPPRRAPPDRHTRRSNSRRSPNPSAGERRGIAEPGRRKRTSLAGNPAAMKIATLGGPAVTIEQPASAKTERAKPDRSAPETGPAHQRTPAHRRARAPPCRRSRRRPRPQAYPFDPQATARAKR